MSRVQHSLSAEGREVVERVVSVVASDPLAPKFCAHGTLLVIDQDQSWCRDCGSLLVKIERGTAWRLPHHRELTNLAINAAVALERERCAKVLLDEADREMGEAHSDEEAVVRYVVQRLNTMATHIRKGEP